MQGVSGGILFYTGNISSKPQVRAAVMSAGAFGFVGKSESPEIILKTLMDCGF